MERTPRILIVDDDKPVRELLGAILHGNGFKCTLASNAHEARTFLNKNEYELIVSDINMPGESGLDFIQSALSEHNGIAGIMLTAIDDSFVAEKAIESGVYDYITKPFSNNEVLISVINALRRRDLEVANRSYQKDLEKRVHERTSKLRKTMEGIIKAMASTVEWRDPYTAGHQQRVTRIASDIASALGFSEEQKEGIRMGSLVHDLGKISVPAEILSKPGRLTEMEFGIIKEHPKIGYEILKDIEFPSPVSDMVLQHHERINGSGYPFGLAGAQIIKEARILAVADVVEAMASHRPYRPALGIDAALEEITKNRGVLYDEDAVDACLSFVNRKGFDF
jgi:putative nucleotidyltransferase with HDIG domain